MSTYPPNQTTPKSPSGNYLWNWLGSPLKSFAAALSPYMSGGDAGVKKYVALLTQSGIDAPVATVLENTIGNIVWTYNVSGQYYGTLQNAFPENKFFVLMPVSGYDSGVNGGGGGDPYSYYRLSDDTIIVVTNSDSILYNSPIEIRVYP